MTIPLSKPNPNQKATKRPLRIDYKHLREFIYQMRVGKQITLREVSDKTGYSTEQLYRIETGDGVLPDFTMLFRILDAIGCDIVLRNRDTKGKKPKQQLLWEEIGNGYKQRNKA